MLNSIKKIWDTIKKVWKWILLVVVGGGVVLAATTQSLTPNEMAWKDFTDNLKNIDYVHQGIPVEQLDNSKGIWMPTEQEFEEIYQYIYGNDMVVWQKLDGTEMCPLQKDGTGRVPCVPHWEQEYNNAQEKGSLRNEVRKNEVNADIYDIQLTSSKSNWKDKIIGFLQNLIQYVYAAVEFEDNFNVSVGIDLKDHTPTGTGTGYTDLITVGSCDLYIHPSDDNLSGSRSISFGGCGSSEGELCEGDDTMSSADYVVKIDQINGDTVDDRNALACRIQDADNMYAVIWNESDSYLYEKTGGVWADIGGGDGGGIADGSKVELICEGTSISVEDDDAEILSATDDSHTSAGKAGVGMGDIGADADDDVAGQILDDFVVTVTPSADQAANLELKGGKLEIKGGKLEIK